MTIFWLPKIDVVLRFKIGGRSIDYFLVIQPSRSFFNKADDAAKAKAEQAANAEQSEQNVSFRFGPLLPSGLPWNRLQSDWFFQDGEVTIEQENESLKQQVEELLAKVEAMTKKETDLSYKLAELSDEYKRQGARFKRETEKTKVSQIFWGRSVP